jgi:PAS domain S-box-containing protein
MEEASKRAPKRILVVEDEGIIALDIQGELEGLGYAVCAIVATGEAAVAAVEQHRPDLVLMDIHLRGEMDGIQAADRIQDRFGIPIVYLTANADEATLQRARITGPFGYLLKPFQERDLHVHIEMALTRHGLERRLKDRERELDAILRGIADGVVATDPRGQIRFVNTAATTLTGWDAASAIGRALDQVVAIESSAATGDGGEPPSPSGEGVLIEEGMLISRDGRRIPVENRQTRMDGDHGSVLAIRDITDRKLAEAELLRARDAALELAGLKSAFLANMSHEIRTPLNVILGCVDLILDFRDDIDETTRSLHGSIKRATKRLIATIQGILDLSKIEVGSFQANAVEIDLAKLVHDEFEDLRPLAAAKKLAMSLQIDAAGSVFFDVYCLAQALRNLLDNAIKFTSTGGISTTVARDGDGLLFVEVSDSGVGIAEQYMARLFEPFSQEQAGRTRAFEGNGLGLALVKAYLDRGGASISVESKKGSGTTFRIHFPHKIEVARPVDDPSGV